MTTTEMVKNITEYFNDDNRCWDRVEFLIDFRDEILSKDKDLKKELLKFWEIPSNDHQFEGCIKIFKKLTEKKQQNIFKWFKCYEDGFKI